MENMHISNVSIRVNRLTHLSELYFECTTKIIAITDTVFDTNKTDAEKYEEIGKNIVMQLQNALLKYSELPHNKPSHTN